MRRLWRRSLGVRVVASTLLASSLVVAVVSVLVVRQVAHGVVDAKVRAALAQSRPVLDAAQAQARVTDASGDGAVDRLLDDLTGSLSRQGGSAGLFDLVIVSLTATPGRTTHHVVPQSVPDALRVRVAAGYRASTYTRIRYDDGRWAPGFVVGDTLPVGGTPSYAVYLLYPMSQERSTVALVQHTVAAACVALVLLLAALAGIVTRQVVRPVRQAARTAQRLAAGRLEERLAGHGEDDIGRLADSFNAMAQALQQQIRRLEELSRVQRRFVSDVSHELRTPLATIRMAADLLHDRRQAFDPETARAAELLESQIGRFESLLADLLEISRHDAGAAVLEAEATDLREVLRRSVEEARPLAEARATELRLLVPATALVAEVDPRRVARILRNLLENAVEHGEGRPVLVEAAGDPVAVAVVVRDQGVGLRPGDAALVFQRFWRGDPARARTTGGTGLGLSIALEDAQLHGGWLQAWGEPGRGSAFRLTLPRVARHPVRASPLSLEPPAPVVAAPPAAADPPRPAAADAAPRPAAAEGLLPVVAPLFDPRVARPRTAARTPAPRPGEPVPRG